VHPAGLGGSRALLLVQAMLGISADAPCAR
jgi:hypothetical protein